MWCVYMLRCADGTLYTGVTNRLEHRLKMHARGTASKYTRSRLPVELVYEEPQPDRGAALSRELQIKRFKRAAKEELLLARAEYPSG